MPFIAPPSDPDIPLAIATPASPPALMAVDARRVGLCPHRVLWKSRTMSWPPFQVTINIVKGLPFSCPSAGSSRVSMSTLASQQVKGL